MIHPTAIVHSGARLHESVTVGPYAVIDEHVELGAGCVVGPHVHLTGRTIAGSGNRFHAGAVIGDAPQDLKYKDAPSRLRIGNDNVFREHVTVHRATTQEEDTIIGSNCFLMASSHVGHNTVVGDQVILANGALLAGHVVVGDRAFISGNAVVHQFVRVGTLALMQGGSAISKDLAPFCMSRNDTANSLCGLNTIGLRRLGIPTAERQELRRLYLALFRSGNSPRQAAERARGEFKSPGAIMLIEFILSSKRGVCTGANGASGESDE